MSVATRQERRNPRWSTRIPVRYQVFDGREGGINIGRLHSGRARDIGSQGLFLQCAQLQSGTRLHIFFELPETCGGCVEVFGEVVHERARLDAMGYEVPGVGVKIGHIADRDRTRLQAYLDERTAIDAAVLSASQVRLRALSRQRQQLA